MTEEVSYTEATLGTFRFNLPSDPDPDEPYDMDRPDLGHALIINNVVSEFTQSMKDVDALRSAYQRVGFKVTVHTDCNAQQMKDLKDWMTSSDTHINSNCFSLNIIAHGDKDGWLMDRHERKSWFTEQIVRDLGLVETLIGKPKLVFLQACRGEHTSTGQKVTGNVLATLVAGPNIVADLADFFIAYATVPGFAAHAGGPSGSPYVQLFSKYLRENYLKRPLDRIYLMVKQAMETVVQHRIVVRDGKKVQEEMRQCPEERNTLRRLLLFSEYHKQSKAGLWHRKNEALSTHEQEIEIHLAEKDNDLKNMEMNNKVDHKRKSKQERKSARVTASRNGLKFKVINTVNTGFNNKYNPEVAVLSDGSVVALGEKDGDWKLKRFNMKESAEIFSEELEDAPFGVTEITVQGKPALAISYGGECRIEFLNLGDINTLIGSALTGNLKPEALNTVCPSTLLFADRSKQPVDIYSLDCSGYEPILDDKKISTQLMYVGDLHYVPDEKKPLLIATNSLSASVHVYNTLNSELEWKREMDHRSVAADDCDHLLVCKRGDMRMISVSNGKDLKYSIGNGNNCLGEALRVRWCKNLSSFIVAHYVKKSVHISAIQFE